MIKSDIVVQAFTEVWKFAPKLHLNSEIRNLQRILKQYLMLLSFLIKVPHMQSFCINLD